MTTCRENDPLLGGGGGGAGGGRPLVTTLTSSSGVTVTMGEIKEELCEALALAQQRQYEAQRDLSPLYNNLIDRAARTSAEWCDRAGAMVRSHSASVNPGYCWDDDEAEPQSGGDGSATAAVSPGRRKSCPSYNGPKNGSLPARHRRDSRTAVEPVEGHDMSVVSGGRGPSFTPDCASLVSTLSSVPSSGSVGSAELYCSAKPDKTYYKVRTNSCCIFSYKYF